MAQARAKKTIYAVAVEAGVSAATVSRVLNNRPGVHERTKQSVLAAVERLNYTPSLSARELSSKQVTQIGLSNAYGNRRLTPFNTIFRERLYKELYQQGFRFDDIASLSNGKLERPSDIMILNGLADDDPRISHLKTAEIPFVVIGETEDSFSVAADDYSGGVKAAEHLIRLNHRDMLVVTGGSARPRTAHFSSLGQAAFERQRGFEDALTKVNITLGPERVVRGEFTSLGAFLAVSRALKAGVAFSAVFALSDEMAEGAIAALEDTGLTVPADVSVIGYDDLPEVGETFTTIRQNIEDLTEATVVLIRRGVGAQSAASHQASG